MKVTSNWRLMSLAPDQDKRTFDVPDLIWVTPKWPFPTNDGARLATRHLLEPLTLLGVRIHLVAIVPDGETVDENEAIRELGLTAVTVVRRSPSTKQEHVRNGLSRPTVPITFAPYATRRVAEQIVPVLMADSTAPVVFDGLHAASWLLKSEPVNNPMVYRAHNVERDIWLRGGDQTKGPRKLLLKQQGWLVGRFEADISRRVRMVLPVSSQDSAAFTGWSNDVHTVPIGLEAPEPGPFPTGEPNVLFVGRLDWPPNRDGLEWVLKEVWPAVSRRRPELTLSIVGSGSSEWLAPYRNLQGVTVLGRVDKLPPYYDACCASLVPVFYGSGTRVKGIEASLQRRVCISTAVGVEGLTLRAGQEFIAAESADEWIDAISSITLEGCESMGLAAFDRASDRFDRMAIARDVISELQRRGLLRPSTESPAEA
ncbi:MAG: glycosyltransferase involved in cell wall biosynthesis [Myxococcota bacterium]|jgi:glycosyltransferase involved in cell wall biosynthesis